MRTKTGSKRSETSTSMQAQSASFILNDPRWQAVLHRDRSADGTFVYSVRSTGVFCRPGCSSRTPRPENVRFHASPDDAIRAGYRPCRRCTPTEDSTPAAAAIAAVCRAIEQAVSLGNPAPQLDVLAATAGLSRFHLHRVFRSTTGLTPHQYATARRAEHIVKNLRESATVTDSVYETGFQSSSRFYRAAATSLGMTPTQFRNGARGSTITYAIAPSSLGMLLVARSTRGICAILMADTEQALLQELTQRFPQATLIPSGSEFYGTLQDVITLVEAPHTGATHLPLDIQGTAFQQRVWQALQNIPAGTTASYTEIAERIGSPQAVRAVAGACASNPLAVAIPCHRVVRSNGALSGYRWGVERKQRLLERERNQV